MDDSDDYRLDTQLTHLGNRPHDNHGVVNPPVYHASTILFPTVAAMEAARTQRFGPGTRYGRYGTPTTFALEEALAKIEGGHRAMVLPSGLAAIAAALLGCLKSGEHVLMVDSVYGPARNLCNGVLARYGIESTFYDPAIGAGIGALIKPNTKVVYVESPGSLTFEVQDIPAIAEVAHRAGALVLMDNTWASPAFFPSFARGVDVSIHAATKYIVGHSDVMMGAIVTTEAAFLPIRTMMADLGYHAAPDDIYLALRGLRTLSVRLERHQKNATKVALWLRARPEVDEVLYPALPGARGHDLWKRDFLGATGLFGVILKPAPKAGVDAMLDGLKLFGMGASWGGYESLIQPTNPGRMRTATTFEAVGPMLRLHIGLEDPEDLIADLDKGFERLNAKHNAAAAQ